MCSIFLVCLKLKYNFIFQFSDTFTEISSWSWTVKVKWSPTGVFYLFSALDYQWFYFSDTLMEINSWSWTVKVKRSSTGVIYLFSALQYWNLNMILFFRDSFKEINSCSWTVKVKWSSTGVFYLLLHFNIYDFIFRHSFMEINSVHVKWIFHRCVLVSCACHC